MTNLLLRQHNQTFGGDMESIDNRRGKDMGVPSYVELRKFCGLSEPCDFDDMEDISYEVGRSYYTANVNRVKLIVFEVIIVCKFN